MDNLRRARYTTIHTLGSEEIVVSTYYSVYAEVNIDGHWYSLCPYFKDKSGAVKTSCIYWAQSAFWEVCNELETYALGVGTPADMSDGLKEMFCENPDELYMHSLYYVNFASAIVPKVRKERPFKYEGYVLKTELAAFECFEIDEFSEWLTENEYLALSDKERRQYSFYRWNDPYGKTGLTAKSPSASGRFASCFKMPAPTTLAGRFIMGLLIRR